MLYVLYQEQTPLKTFVKHTCFAMLLIVSTLSTTQAQNKPLRIAITPYSAPFIMQGKNQIYGFDVAMMGYICNVLKRECQYDMMDFDKILPTVSEGKTDIGVNGITITADRAQFVNFSMPYSASISRFLGSKDLKDIPLTTDLLQKSRLGVKAGTIFEEEIRSLGLKNPTIKIFAKEENMVEALINGSVDIILVDEPAAVYWEMQAAEKIVALGQPITYGYGYGIAVNPNEQDLLNLINQALAQYKNSKDYQNNKFMYLDFF